MKPKLMIYSSNSVWSFCCNDTVRYIKELLSYTDVVWYMGQRVHNRECLLYNTKDGKNVFHTGLVPKVLKHLKKLKLNYEYKSDVPVMEFDEPKLKGVEFRDYQKESIWKALEHGRGVIQAATGLGKSYVFGGIVSAFSQEKILFLVHTQDLVTQMMNDLKTWGIHDVGEWTGTTKRKARVMCSTIQSFHKVVDDFTEYFDIVTCDECHHCNSLDGTYGKTLQLLAAPVKIGLTATLPASQKGKMCLEALIGPVIHKVSVNHGVNVLKMLSKPVINIVETGDMRSDELFDMRGIKKRRNSKSDHYSDEYYVVYSNGIVNNACRNLQILQEAEKRVNEGKTVLINVVQIEHIEELMRMAEAAFSFTPVPVHGTIKKEDRERIKRDFESKKIKCVVATSCWQEGISINSINCCILAGAGKSEIKTLQFIGRGLRKDKETNKSTVEIVDFKDTCHAYFENHFKARMKIYKENCWL